MNERKNRICGIASIVLAVVNAFGLFGFAFSLLFIMPKFAAMYADFGAPIPFPTQVVLAIPKSVVIIGTGLLFALLIWKEFIPKKTTPLILNIAWLGAGLVISLLLASALMAPMMGCVQTVSGRLSCGAFSSSLQI